ncbi:MAG: beta-N-acetylhexosaminidase [Bacteroidota bacterium]
MKKYLISLLLFVLPLFAQENTHTIIPQPVEYTRLSGSFDITPVTTVTFSTKDARDAADLLVARLNNTTGFSLTPAQGKSGAISIVLNDKPLKAIGNEGYTLESGANGILITANKPAGLFYAVQTLMQLLPPAVEAPTPGSVTLSVPAVKILDYPRFGWRGLMLDVSRHFFPKEDVKKFIDQMVKYKFNTFHWHLTDDHGWRIEIKSLPKLTEVGAWRVERFGLFSRRSDPLPGEPATVGGFYTQEEIKEIVAYAQERHVTILPEIDMPGHCMAVIASYPELSVTKDTSIKVNPGTHFAEWYGNGTFKMNVDNTLNPSDEKVYEFIDKVFTELAAIFPNPYIHVGGDECYKGFWKQDEGCRALMKKLNIRHVEDLQGYFMGRVEKILKKKGKKLIGWDEILEGGISPEATVMSWRGMRGGIEAAKMGHDVVMTPTTYAYLDYNQGEATIEPKVYASLRISKSYEFDPVPDGVDAKRILGGQGNLWAENVPHLRAAQYLIFPRAWAISEVLWSPKEKKEWNDFSRRMEYHFLRADAAGVNYSRAVFDPMVRTSYAGKQLMLTLGAEIDGIEIFYTIDDTMPDRYSKKYLSPVPLPDGPITLRVQAYRDGAPIGRLIVLLRDELERRATR